MLALCVVVPCHSELLKILFYSLNRLHPMSGIGAAFALMQRDRPTVQQQMQTEEDEAV